MSKDKFQVGDLVSGSIRPGFAIEAVFGSRRPSSVGLVINKIRGTNWDISRGLSAVYYNVFWLDQSVSNYNPELCEDFDIRKLESPND